MTPGVVQIPEPKPKLSGSVLQADELPRGLCVTLVFFFAEKLSWF